MQNTKLLLLLFESHSNHFLLSSNETLFKGQLVPHASADGFNPAFDSLQTFNKHITGGIKLCSEQTSEYRLCETEIVILLQYNIF